MPFATLRRPALSFALVFALSLPAVAASPQLNIIMPRGCQRGAEADLNFQGARLADAQEILFYEPGIEVLKLEAAANVVKAHIRVAADCPLGEHTAQVRSATGVSEFRTFYVGPFPSVDEKEPNTTFEQPQPITLNVTVAGVSDNEDVDYYVVEAKKGQRIAVEVEAMRLSGQMFDPYVAILDSKRFELASADDIPLFRQDAAAACVAPEDGKYTIEVRDAAYGGNGNCRYRLHVGTFTRPTAVYPAGGKKGEVTKVKFLGDPAGVVEQDVTVPTTINGEYQLFANDAGGSPPSGNTFRAFDQGNVLEAEPNNDVATATPATLPLAFNGIVAEAGDVDCFKFAATKGQVWEIECYARRIRSGLDPVINLYYADGRGIAGNDDARGPDSYLRFNVPQDGEYIVRVTDHLGKGKADYVYRLEMEPVKPALTLGIPQTGRYSQYRQWVVIPKGNRFATLISANRANFGGELLLGPKDLPPGVKIIAQPMAANMTLMPVVFEAAPDAPTGGKLVDLRASLKDNPQVEGGYSNRAEYIISSPGQSLYCWKDVNLLPVVVADEAPFKLEIVQPKAPLVKDGALQLKVVATRKSGFDKPIHVEFPFRSPGVGAAAAVDIPQGQNEVLYPVNAAGNAQVAKWPMYVIGSSDVDGQTWVSSQMAELEIGEPFVTLKVQRAAVEQGKEVEIAAEVTVGRPFTGAAKCQLLGLPHNVTAPEMEINAESKEVVFKVTTKPDSPVGTHKNIICQVTVTENGEPVVHSRAGVTELRIDAPPPPKPAAPAQPAPAAQPAAAAAPPPMPAAAPAKRLTRLEQLRQAAQEAGK